MNSYDILRTEGQNLQSENPAIRGALAALAEQCAGEAARITRATR